MQTQEVTIKPSVKVVMKSDTEMLDEVMVVAFGTAKKSAFTGSAKVIGTEKLEQSQQQLERTQQELSALAEAAGDGQQQEKLKAQAELLCAACDLTEELFDREEG
mgnify:CR=1 FL=1